jgi:hypothetical protein
MARILTENHMHNPIELELLVRHIGKAKGIELVRLSRIPPVPGAIAQAAIDALAAAPRGSTACTASRRRPSTPSRI